LSLSGPKKTKDTDKILHVCETTNLKTDVG